VPSNVTLSRFHGDIQTVMGWSNSHLHQFEIGDLRYGSPDPDYIPVFGDPVHDERKSRLGSLAQKGDRFIYEYDFGDSWEHEIVTEQILTGPRFGDVPLPGRCKVVPALRTWVAGPATRTSSKR
jgi:hypothetical protein